ncbi:Uma2 family endonuclease [Spirulina sp. CS-785/01]|uniref:Uma2 family endonuclease n=1 Tax=Spirulina sp. CS-785/01 TaxID=3021716 RepID=UPI00232B5586|nr:Uma2 family endonuclease [Spirulina sp. CS-785/01]MDB9313980.1 Uma2 family endonuclease [Spirulina sp. CS-785/01]
MVAILDKQPVSMQQFLDWYPENTHHRYELRRGGIVEMPKPRGKHSEIAGFVIKQLNNQIDSLQVPYFIPRECILKISEDTGYEPDIAVVNRPSLVNESRWESSSVIEQGKSVKLVVEVVSTNWRDDYALKMSDYESIGIGEYWILDYLGLGGRRYIGSPKQPTFTVCRLVEEEYEIQQFRSDDPIISPTFPDFPLTVNQVFLGNE